MAQATTSEILDFWFVESGPDKWFKKDAIFDQAIKQRFEATAQARADELQHRGWSAWETNPKGALALLLLLDQFPRNMYRDEAGCFAWDDLALAVAKRAIKNGYDMDILIERRSFFYMPFMHSEDLADQDRCCELTSTRLKQGSTAKFARLHRDVIERFGRFPYRNEILGRESTLAETAFLQGGGFAP